MGYMTRIPICVSVILQRILPIHLSDDTESFSSPNTVRMGMLYTLIWALVLAQEFADYTSFCRIVEQPYERRPCM